MILTIGARNCHCSHGWFGSQQNAVMATISLQMAPGQCSNHAHFIRKSDTNPANMNT